MSESNFTKTLLQSYIITDCDRRLFLELGKNKPHLWFDPVRSVPIEPPDRMIFQRKYLIEKGKEYEQRVYASLRYCKDTQFMKDNQGNITNSVLNKETLLQCYESLLKERKKNLMLLEYQYTIPSSFFSDLFPPKPSTSEIPINYADQRPDIIILGNGINKYINNVLEMLPDGVIRKISPSQLSTRIGITIFDIKYVQDEHVGKKHFLEIFYYLKTLAVQLQELQLLDKFYVRANFNGIVPFHSKEELRKIRSIEDLFTHNLVNIISWREADRIFIRVMMVIRDLWIKAPCPIEAILLNIHQGCGYCHYIEDCKITLGMKNGSDPRTWSSRLLPFTSQSMAQQLIEEYNLTTIGEVFDHIDSISIGAIPKPLYSELPTLKIKAESLIHNRPIYPPLGQTQSYAIPRYSPIALNFDVEYDRNNDKIFGIGLYLKMFIHSKLNYHAIFDNWWKIWKKALEDNTPLNEIFNELNQYLIRKIPLEVVNLFHQTLLKLRKVQIFLRGEKQNAGTKIEYTFASINNDITPESEASLIIYTIRRLNLILALCNIIEDYVVVDGFQAGTYFGPDTGIFYWSRNQLDHFQDMMERHLGQILDDTKARSAYESILMYLSPSETEVSHPFQHKKLFDIQAFVDSFLGFPDIINYTWHGIAHNLFNYNVNPKFWVPHFNFLDLTNWLKYLSKDDQREKESIETEIKRQISIKLRYINSIREYFQREGRYTLSQHSNVIGRADYTNAILPVKYHDIAHVWYLFSKLNNALQQQDDEYYRAMFPQFSIGKLFSAEVSHLTIHTTAGKTVYYSFETIGLSSNMKISEGDNVLLIPNFKRGLKIDSTIFKWVVYIDSLVWDSNINGNRIATKPTYSNLFEQCTDEGVDPEIEQWFIYPLSTDAWSNKLHNQNNNGLLEREGFGRSWLGFRLAYLWNIRTNPQLLWPPKWEFNTSVIYLFAPELLEFFKGSNQPQLTTLINPIPDSSQQEAILNSLNHIISGILGPPGTGKSQTIAALVDEVVMRKYKEKKPFKILITSFSYAALRVVLNKIRTSKTNHNSSTLSARTQMIFLRSETQDPIEPIKGCRNVDDLMRAGKTWKWNGKSRIITPTQPLEDTAEESFILFTNAHHLYYLHERVREDFAFDLICVDESSQLPTDYFMASLQYIHKHTFHLNNPKDTEIIPDSEINNKDAIKILDLSPETRAIPFEELTKIVIVGDHNQLPPVRVKNPPKNLELILDSLFYYYIKGHIISTRQLKVNYRSHQDIVSFTSLLGLYQDLRAHNVNATTTLQGNLTNIKQGWIKEVLAPERVVCSLIHNRKFEIGISEFEADLILKIVIGFYEMITPHDRKEEQRFWKERIGVVAPHNAQGRTIIRRIYEHFRDKTHFSERTLMDYLKNTIYSVEKFQGSDRDMIITSIGLSDKDKISAEEEFIFDLNRFNVLTSRAKHKVIFVSSAEFLHYIPEDRKVLDHASKVYLYVNDFCNHKVNLTLKNEINNEEQIEFRFRV